MDTLPSGTTHPTHVHLGAVCPFPHWVGYFPQSLMVHHLTSLHVIMFMKAMSIIVHVVILVGIVAILTHQIPLTHLIPLDLVSLLTSPIVIVLVQTV